MGQRYVIFCLIVILICPLAFGIGMGLWTFMPDCKIGSGDPASGCVLIGVNINSFMQFAVIQGFLGSFLLTPVGILLLRNL